MHRRLFLKRVSALHGGQRGKGFGFQRSGYVHLLVFTSHAPASLPRPDATARAANAGFKVPANEKES